jgi:NADH-quinone oxidoreductase subunit F
MFGTGAIIILDETASVVRSALVLARFYEHESCGQCSQCREGTEWQEQIIDRLLSGRGKRGDVELLVDMSNGMFPGKTICALSDAAAIPVLAAIKHFRSEFDACIATTEEVLA